MALSTIPFSGLGADASNQGVNFRNLIINGDMSIAQRGTSFINTGGGYTLDRHTFAKNTDGGITITQDTDVPTGQGFANSFKIDVTTADTSIGASQYALLQHRIEGQMLQHLKYGTSSAEKITLSFWIKSNKTGTYCISILKTAGDGTRYDYVAEYTISSASTWEKKTITIEPDSNIQSSSGAIKNDNSSGLYVMWALADGSDRQGTNETWNTSLPASSTSNQVNFMDSTSNYINITGLQLEVGTSASDFEFLPYDVNLRRCQRYYEILGYDEGSGNALSVGQKRSTSSAQGCWVFRVDKRTNPTLSLIGDVTDLRIHDSNGGNMTGSSISGNGTPGKTSTWIGLNTSNSGTDNTPCLIYMVDVNGGAGYTADAEL